MAAPTPVQIESRLVELGRDLDSAFKELADTERGYYSAKGEYEVAFAKAKLTIRSKFASSNSKITVAEVEDSATIQVQDLLIALYTSEALVKTARANSSRVRTQIEIARSVSASVRASLDLL